VILSVGPEKYLYNQIFSIAEIHGLRKSFSMNYPDQDFAGLFNAFCREYDVRRKHVQGYGDYVFFMSRGRTHFHEFILKKFVRRLRYNSISYKLGNVRRGADLFVFDIDRNRYAIELETALYNSSEKRFRLADRIMDFSDNTVFVLVLNTVDKRRYHNSGLLYLYKDVRILTLDEFIPYFKNNFL
jgi:hypothetical protein